MVWQAASAIIAFVLLTGGIITVFFKLKVDIAQMQIEIINIKKDMVAKEIALLNIEKFNREDHIKILDKVDKIMGYVKK